MVDPMPFRGIDSIGYRVGAVNQGREGYGKFEECVEFLDPTRTALRNSLGLRPPTRRNMRAK